MSRPTIVVLCGSSRFKDTYTEANRRETLAGRIVLSVGMFGHDEGLDMDGPVKVMLDGLHLAKVDLADEVLVLNPRVPLGAAALRRGFDAAGGCVRSVAREADPVVGIGTGGHLMSRPDRSPRKIDFLREAVDRALLDARGVDEWCAQRIYDDPTVEWMTALAFEVIRARGNASDFNPEKLALSEARKIAAFALLLLSARMEALWCPPN